MAKKKTTRRVPQTSTPRMYSDGKPSQVVAGTASVSGTGVRPASGAAAASRGPVDLSKEYSFVPGDLKRLGITAAALFAGMFVLSLFIR
jgi:hypothetical protein